MTINKIENCGGGDAILKVNDGLDVQMTDSCQIVVSGCINTKAFNDGKVKYKVNKSGMTLLEGADNYCNLISKAEGDVKQLIDGFGIPKSCPIPEKEYCGQNVAIDISKYKNYLSFAKGKVDIEGSIEHDTGNSCYKVQLNVHK